MNFPSQPMQIDKQKFIFLQRLSSTEEQDMNVNFSNKARASGRYIRLSDLRNKDEKQL